MRGSLGNNARDIRTETLRLTRVYDPLTHQTVQHFSSPLAGVSAGLGYRASSGRPHRVLLVEEVLEFVDAFSRVDQGKALPQPSQKEGRESGEKPMTPGTCRSPRMRRSQ